MRRFSLFDLFGIASLIVGTMFFIVFVLILPRSWTGSNYEALMGLPDAAPTLIGTAAPTEAPSLTPTATPIPYDVSFFVDNQSDSVICAVYAKLDHSDLPAINLLAGEPPLEPLTMRRLRLLSGAYLFRAEDCDGNEIARQPIELSSTYTWTITED